MIELETERLRLRLREATADDLLAVNGLRIRPALNRKVVMGAREAAALCTILKPRYAVPMHYAFTAGPVRDRLLLKYTGTAEEFARVADERAPATDVRVLTPGEPLRIEAMVTEQAAQ